MYSDMTQSADADHYYTFSGKEMVSCLLCYVIRRQARVCVRSDIFRG